MIPGDYEIDLYRISNGEPIRWKGLSSGVTEKLQGYVMLAAGAAMALTFAPGAVRSLEALLELQSRSGAEDWFNVGRGLLNLVGAASGLFTVLLGWRTLRSAGRVVWAVTSRRLIRMVGGDADHARSWAKADILNVERRIFGEPKRDGLAVTVRARRRGRRRSQVLTIMGPPDLDVAERALAALED